MIIKNITRTPLILFMFSIFLLFLFLPIAFALSAEQREEYNTCKTNCLEIKNAEKEICTSNYLSCRSSCQSNYTCSSSCIKTKSECMREVNKDHNSCQKVCREILVPKCLNGTYNAGETFVSGCDVCKCNTNGKVSCKKEAFCNKNTSVSEEECKPHGLYYPLCNGPYFDIVCSQEKFCLCSGFSNYSCPNNHECLKDFISPNKRTQNTIIGFKDLLGRPLGDIGVCVKGNI